MHDVLQIECIRYDDTSSGRHCFYLSSLATLEVTTLLDETITFTRLQLFAHTGSEVLRDSVVSTFQTLGHFNKFYINHPGYHIHDFEADLSDGTTLESHDDGEVHITLPPESNDLSLLERIWSRKELPTSLIGDLMAAPGSYFKIAPNGDILGIFKTFDAYLQRTQ